MIGPGSRARAPATRLPVMAMLVTLAGTAAFGDAAAMITLMLRLYRTADASWAVTALLFAILGPSAVLAPVTARILARVGVWRALALTSAIGGRLVTFVGYGHSWLLNGSTNACMDNVVTSYFLNDVVPPKGTRCSASS